MLRELNDAQPPPLIIYQIPETPTRAQYEELAISTMWLVMVMNRNSDLNRDLIAQMDNKMTTFLAEMEAEAGTENIRHGYTSLQSLWEPSDAVLKRATESR